MFICSFNLLFDEWEIAVTEGRKLSLFNLLPAIVAHTKVCRSCRTEWDQTRSKPADAERQAEIARWEPDSDGQSL